MNPVRHWILQHAANICNFGGGQATIGEVEKRINLSRSTIRRHLEALVSDGCLNCEIVEYKSTGKRVYMLTAKGESVALRVNRQ